MPVPLDRCNRPRLQPPRGNEAATRIRSGRGSQSSETHIPLTSENTRTSSAFFTATLSVLSVRANRTASSVLPSAYAIVIRKLIGGASAYLTRTSCFRAHQKLTLVMKLRKDNPIHVARAAELHVPSNGD